MTRIELDQFLEDVGAADLAGWLRRYDPDPVAAFTDAVDDAHAQPNTRTSRFVLTHIEALRALVHGLATSRSTAAGFGPGDDTDTQPLAATPPPTAAPARPGHDDDDDDDDAATVMMTAAQIAALATHDPGGGPRTVEPPGEADEDDEIDATVIVTPATAAPRRAPTPRITDAYARANTLPPPDDTDPRIVAVPPSLAVAPSLSAAPRRTAGRGSVDEDAPTPASQGRRAAPSRAVLGAAVLAVLGLGIVGSAVAVGGLVWSSRRAPDAAAVDAVVITEPPSAPAPPADDTGADDTDPAADGDTASDTDTASASDTDTASDAASDTEVGSPEGVAAASGARASRRARRAPRQREASGQVAAPASALTGTWAGDAGTLPLTIRIDGESGGRVRGSAQLRMGTATKSFTLTGSRDGDRVELSDGTASFVGTVTDGVFSGTWRSTPDGSGRQFLVVRR